MILWHLDFLRYKDERVSTRPFGIREVLLKKNKGSFENALMVLTCVERDDDSKEIKEAVEEIRKTIQAIKSTRKIVIVPFVHLSESIADPKKAIMVLQTLRSELISFNLDVDTISFGYHKGFELHFRGYGHPLAVAFRSFPRKRT